jgi:hypothetical protein
MYVLFKNSNMFRCFGFAWQRSATQCQRCLTTPTALPVGDLGTCGVQRCSVTERLPSVFS